MNNYKIPWKIVEGGGRGYPFLVHLLNLNNNISIYKSVKTFMYIYKNYIQFQNMFM